MALTLTTEATIKLHAGINYDTNLTSGNWETYGNQAEGLICGECGYDFVTNYASINTVGKYLLDLATATLAAILGVKYNMANYQSYTEAQTIMSANIDLYEKTILKLKDEAYRDFVIS